MKSHNSAATDKALALVAAGMSQVQAARACGLAISTVWRACKREAEHQRIKANLPFIGEPLTKNELDQFLSTVN